MKIGPRKTGLLFRIAPLVSLIFVVSCGGGDSGSIAGGGAQPPGNSPPPPGGGTAAFTRQLGGQRFDGATCTAVDASENIYVAGNTWGTVDISSPNPDPTASTSDIFIAKYSAAGILQWVRQFGSSLDDYATGIAVDNTGNVIVVGYTFGDFFGINIDPFRFTSDYFALKMDPAGAQTWALQDGTDDSDEVWCVATDKNDNIYVAGGSRGPIAGIANVGDFDAFVASYTTAGALRWGGKRSSGINLADRDLARAVVLDEQRNYLYVTGDFYFRERNPNVFVERRNPDTGDLDSNDWNVDPLTGVGFGPFVFGTVASDNTPQFDFSTGIAKDRNGNVYVAGYTIQNDKDQTSNAGDVTFELFKLDASGNLIWHSYKPAGPHPGNEARGVVVDSMMDVYLTGYTSVALGADPALGGTDAFIMQFDGDTGATLWTRQFGTVGNDRAFGIAFFDNRAGNNYYVVGESSGAMDGNPNLGGYDAFLVKYNQFGDRL